MCGNSRTRRKAKRLQQKYENFKKLIQTCFLKAATNVVKELLSNSTEPAQLTQNSNSKNSLEFPQINWSELYVQ